jgi:aminoglycoside/choline kinase family phosphotransferase
MKLAGDASNRLYFRVEPDRDETRILALLPGPFDPGELAFLEVSKLFEAIPLRVPRIYEVAGDLGILLLEDLGDLLLPDAVERGCTEGRKNALYRESVSMLVRLQSRGGALPGGRRFGRFESRSTTRSSATSSHSSASLSRRFSGRALRRARAS